MKNYETLIPLKIPGSWKKRSTPLLENHRNREEKYEKYVRDNLLGIL